MKVFSQLEKAQVENTTTDVASMPKGMITYRTDINQLKVSNGTIYKFVIDEDSIQTLSSKILASPEVTGSVLFNQTATPATPAAGKNRLYAKADGKFYTLDSAGNEAVVGAGAGGAVTNLITNGNADDTAATIFVPYADSGTRPVDGTGGSPTVTTSVTTTVPLNGIKSYLLTKPASNVQGQGWAVPFTVDPAFRAKSLKISADYIINSGTFVPGTSTTDGDLIWYIYDVTNSLLIEPSNIKMFSNNTGISDKFEATFQTSVTGASYRLIAHCASTSALAYEIKLDNVTVSPQVYVYGSPRTDFQRQATAPVITGFGGGTLVVGTGGGAINVVDVARDGDEIIARYTYRAGTSGFVDIIGTVVFPYPVGYTPVAEITSQPTAVVGYGEINTVATGNPIARLIARNFSTGFILAVNDTTNLGTASAHTSNANSISIYIRFKAIGISSSVQMSDSADTRVVAMHTMKNTAQSFPSGVNTALTGWVSSGPYYNDTHGSFNPTTGEYTVRVPGFYDIFATADFVANGTGYRYAGISISGPSGGTIFGTAIPGFAADSLRAPVQATRYLDIGAVISIFAFQNSGGNLNTRAGLDGGSIFTVKRLSGPSAIAASEKIKASYSQNSSQVIATGGFTTFIANIKEWDTHGVYNTSTGEFTFPRAGFVTVKANALFNATAAAGTYIFGIYKNGSLLREIGRYNKIASNINAGPSPFSLDVDGVVGDKLTLRIYQDTGAPVSLVAGTAYNTVQFSMD